MPDNIRGYLQEDPTRFIGTRWVFADIDSRYEFRHYCEIIEVREGKALLVTLYSEPLQHWWVPLTDLLATFAAFKYIGRREDLLWIRTNGYAWYTGESDPPEEEIRRRQSARQWNGIWQIEHITQDVIWMVPRANRHSSASLAVDFFTLFRQPTDDEIRAGRGYDRLVLAEQRLSDDPPLEQIGQQPIPDPAPPPTPEEGPPPRSAWERLRDPVLPGTLPGTNISGEL